MQPEFEAEAFAQSVEESFQQASGKFRSTSFRDVVSQKVSFRWLVKNYLPFNSFACLYGDKGTGKSFYALDICMHIAMGKEWRGRRVEQAGVLYQVGEGSSGVPKRLQAWMQEFGDPGNVPFRTLQHVVDLYNSESDVREFIEEARRAEKEMGHKVGLIVIDTLARALVGGNDGDGAAMGKFINNVETIKRELDCAALILHHCGKDASRGARGHSSLGAAADTMFELTRSETGLISVRMDKQKDEASGFRDYFRLRRVVVGLDDDGDEISSCVIAEGEKINIHDQVKLKGIDKIAMECLVQTLLDHGEYPQGVSLPKGVKAVKWKKWKERCFASGILLTDDQNKLNNAFVNAGKSLRARNLIGTEGQWVWDARSKPHVPITAEPILPDSQTASEEFEQAEVAAGVQHEAPKLPQ